MTKIQRTPIDRIMESLNAEIPAIVFLSVIILIVFLPVYTSTYLYHDDWVEYPHWSISPFDFQHGPRAPWHLMNGRPLANLSIGLLFSIDALVPASIAGASLSRLFVVFLIAIFAVLQYQFLILNKVDRDLATWLVLGIVFLPGTLTLGFFLNAGSLIFSLLGALLAGLICNYVAAQSLSWKLRVLLALAATAFFVLALFVHQATAMYFWTTCAIAAVLQMLAGDRNVAKTLGTYAVVGICGTLSYLVWFKYSGTLDSLALAAPYRGIDLSPQHLIKMFTWFVHTVIPRAGLLWFQQGSQFAGWLIVGLLISVTGLASIAVFRKRLHHGQTDISRLALVCLFNFFVVCVLGILSFSPTLVTNSRLNVYRSLIPLSSLMVTVTVLSLDYAIRGTPFGVSFRKFLVVGGVALSIYSSCNLESNMVGPARAECSLLRTAIADIRARGNGDRPVHVIIPQITHPLDTDELCLSILFPEHNIRLMVDVLRREAGLNAVPVTFSIEGQPYDSGDAVLVDMTPLAKARIARVVAPE